MSDAVLLEENKRLKQKIADMESNIADLTLDNIKLTDQVRVLQLLHFGPKSEKMTSIDNLTTPLFNEAEDNAFRQNDIEQEQLVTDTVEIAAHSRTTKKKKEPGRTAFDPSLPRKVVSYDITEEEKSCTCGSTLQCIGEDVAERAKVYPPKVEIIQERKKKYVCTSCEGLEREDEKGVITAPGKLHLIPGSSADESLLAWSITEKFIFALPFYRQSIRLSHIGMPIPRATLSNLAVTAGKKCKPLYELLKETICSGEVINMDETSVQVLKEPGRRNQMKSWMWTYYGGPPGEKSIVFQYEPGRNHEIPYNFLKRFSGWLQTDDYEAYHTALRKLKADRGIQISHVLCWAHARRKFYKYWEKTKDTKAKQILDLIGELFKLEDLRTGISQKEFMKQRKYRAALIFSELKELLLELYPETPPGLSLGKAIAYTLDNWGQLITYIGHVELTPSNNVAERAIRPFVIGRKNWLFAGSPAGAKSSAILYSLVESAKIHDLLPMEYLYYIFCKIPYCHTKDDFRTLLPFNIDPQQLKTDR